MTFRAHLYGEGMIIGQRETLLTTKVYRERGGGEKGKERERERERELERERERERE